jgi:transposase
MQRRTIEITVEQQRVVEAALRRRDLTPRVRERLEMVKAVALGQDMATIVAWSGRAEATIWSWVQRFVQGGVGALADAPRCGRPARADAAYHQALERAVTTPPRELGLGFDVWTSGRLSTYLAETTGITLAASWIRGLLRQHRFACGRPKHTLKHLQDLAEVAACQAELEAAEKKGGRGAREVRAASSR